MPPASESFYMATFARLPSPTLNLGPRHSSCPSCHQQSAGSAATPSQNHARAASITSHPSLARPVEKRSPLGGHPRSWREQQDGRQPPAGEGPGFRCPLAGNQAEPGQPCQAPLLMPGVGASCLQAGVSQGWLDSGQVSQARGRPHAIHRKLLAHQTQALGRGQAHSKAR